MNKFESKQLHPKLDIDEGWAVQVYGGNRRLLCVLGPSHGWIFLAGCCAGLLLSVIWFNLARYSSPVEPTVPGDTPALHID
ncbi:MAG: hypothetical protein AAFW95_02570 [Cyanobacteria bacterium J06638_6]|jgi:hypothetical protein